MTSPSNTASRGGPLRILGAMTGTSCDGIDATCIELSSGGWQVLWRREAAYPAGLRARVLKLQKPGTRVPVRELLMLDRDLGEWYGAVLGKMIRKSKPSERPDVIANHGQTVAHHPDDGVTLQLGDSSRIAARTGCTVVAQFRNGDLAAGGQGAPLAPRFHQWVAAMLPEAEQGIAIHNMGGISNLTYIHPSGRVLAFDTGPGCSWIDAAASEATRGRMKMDRGGSMGIRGRPDGRALDRMLKHPFLKRSPPKSTGRDDFPYEMFQKATRSKGEDRVATATWYTIETAAIAYERWILKRKLPLAAIYLCGGGAKNMAIAGGLEARLDDVPVRSIAGADHDPQSMESHAFAMFGLLALMGSPLGGEWTGARGFAPPAHLIPGENWRDVLLKLRALNAG